MEAFTVLTSVAAPLPVANVNTDDIFPSPGANPIRQGAAPTGGDGLGKNAFAALRWNPDGTPRPEFVLNRPPYDQAAILLALENFGCGSSREVAVWALLGTGIRCVIAPTFGDIFYNNCCKNGLLPVRLPHDAVRRLMALADDPGRAMVTVDLTTQRVTASDGAVHAFDIDSYRRGCLLEGLDEIGETLKRREAIEGFEHAYDRRRPWVARSGPSSD
jgi:3-isopropylmalate/(R)-2-methylmalate dehydratase small subunit